MQTPFRSTIPAPLFIVVVLMATAAQPDAARAQLRTEDLRFYGGAHLAVPVSLPGPEETSYSAGSGLSLGLSVRIADRWAFRASGNLSRLGLQNTAESESIGRAGENPSGNTLYRSAATLSVQRFLSTDDDLRFYLLGGVGWDRYDADFSSLADNGGAAAYGHRTESAISVEGGIGLLAPLSYTAAFFIEPRYHLSFTTSDHAHFVPITVGLVFGEF